MEERLPSFKEIVEDESFIRWVKNNSWQDANDWEEKIRQNHQQNKDTSKCNKKPFHYFFDNSHFSKGKN